MLKIIIIGDGNLDGDFYEIIKFLLLVCVFFMIVCLLMLEDCLTFMFIH